MAANEKKSKQRVLMVHNFYQIGGGEHTVFENEQKLLREYGHFLITYTRNNAEILQIWEAEYRAVFVTKG